jgi:RND family efflux transporter MFP subunit
MIRRLSFLLVLLAVAACGKGRPDGAAAAPASAAALRAPLLLSEEDVRVVGVGVTASGPLVTGSLQPERRADLRAEVSAVVLQVLKDNGEPVRAGELLVRLDDTSIRDSVASADESARVARQAAEQAERIAQRQKTLQAQGMISTQALEDAEMRQHNAQSDLVAARGRLVAARQQLQRTEVRAPFDGVVSERKVSAGDTAQVGKELLKVIDPRSMRFEGMVSADRLHEIRVGQPVMFRVNGYATSEFAGKLLRIDASANATTRQVAVLVGFADPAAAPRVAGLFAEGRIESAHTSAPMLPEASIVWQGEQAFVWRLRGGMLQKAGVQLGERDARRGEYPVRAGLADGERVLRNPTTTLVDGQRVEVAHAASAPAAAPSAAAAMR